MAALMWNSRTQLRSLGGERLHLKYMAGASEEMMASVRLTHAVSDEDYAAVHALATA